ncbi:MAG: DUF4398 domain-containing protein [Natronosporangium sp.]
MKNRNVYPISIALGLFAAGCATVPEGPALEEARAAFQRVENDPQVVSKAPVALERAEEALAVHREIGHRRGEAEAHLAAGQAREALDDPAVPAATRR